MQRIRRDTRGVSTAIVVALSLVIVVVIVANVFLWNFEMNQLDWEKMREDIEITNVNRVNGSSWFVTQNEYVVNEGTRISGTYEDTQVADDGQWETFRERQPPVTLDINGSFIIDVSIYPLAYIQTIEIQLRYRASDSGEIWYLKAYNWATQAYSDSGFNSTAGHTPTTGWDLYAVNLTDQWSSYVQDEGTIYVKLHDQRPDPPQDRTTIDIEFLGVRVIIDGTSFTFKSEGPLTSHLVSLWVNNSTHHQRYDINIFVNAGDTESSVRCDISLPNKPYTVKVVTERGNIAIYSES